MPPATTPEQPNIAPSAPPISETPEAPSPADQAEVLFKEGLPDGHQEPAVAQEEDTPLVEAQDTSAEIDREAVLRDLDEMRNQLDAMRARFETPANKQILEVPDTETAPVEQAVAAQAASAFTGEEPPPTSVPTVAELASEPPAEEQISSLRLPVTAPALQPTPEVAPPPAE